MVFSIILSLDWIICKVHYIRKIRGTFLTKGKNAQDLLLEMAIREEMF